MDVYLIFMSHKELLLYLKNPAAYVIEYIGIMHARWLTRPVW
jgi:hypothetical protein